LHLIWTDVLPHEPVSMSATRNAVEDIWGARTPYFGPGEWPLRVDENVSEQPERWVQSCCVLCTNGCGLDIGVRDGRIVGVRGRADDRTNRGRLGPKGLHGWMANGSADRLTRPLIRTGRKGAGKFREAAWDEAMEMIVERCGEVRKRYSCGAIGIYNSGQLFIEDYYTLAVVAMAGLGTIHLDGNTRLCTATASIALRETFGSDGQPSTIDDYDTADCILHVGHNVAETQTVSWMRVLDRRRGPQPPKLIVIDPRATPTAREADIHLAPRAGTNVALLNGLIHLMIQQGRIDHDFIGSHTMGFEKLKATVAAYDPQRVEEITQVSAQKLHVAADLIGTAERLLCTVLQGVYQSNQATAAACQVNNLVLIRGMIGRPGCGVIQSNGQPTAQNARETGCNGEWPGFRNWQNPRHMAELARIWNVDPLTIPHWAPKTHAMKIFHLAETGAIKFLWIVGTNPAVSLPELHKIRRMLGQNKLFTVVQDAFLTETACFADVVLPAALWGEKTGTFTNFDRTVHISHKAIEPPGEAKSDMEIFIDFARRMDFRDLDGQPLVKWTTPEECFEAWKACSRGTPCDYSGLSYAKLSATSGIRWPCNEAFPDGKQYLYQEQRFPTGYEDCGDFGHDIETGGHIQPEAYKANDPRGKAWLKAADYSPPDEAPSDEYPFWLITGRLAHHFHTRTKTARSAELNAVAPQPYIEIHPDDAARLKISDGDVVEVTGQRGYVQAPAKIGSVLPGHLFMPFHYGYWDEPKRSRPNGEPRAANELTATTWDPVSKQPHYKHAAVRLDKARSKSIVAKVTDTVEELADTAKELVANSMARAHPDESRVRHYVALFKHSNEEFQHACQQVEKDHHENAEIVHGARLMKRFAEEILDRFKPFEHKYGTAKELEPHKLRTNLFPASRHGDFGLLRDLHGLYLLACETSVTNEVLRDGAMELRDRELLTLCNWTREQIDRQKVWCLTQVQDNAGQSLVVRH
jgi:ferredoxin-nitrate reductase